VSDIEAMEDIVAGSLASRRLVAALSGGFAALALLLAVIGIYGVLAYSVSRRTAEIGVRRALGASTTSLVRLIVGQGLKPVALGLALGVLGAAVLSRLLGELLFGVTPTDPATYAAVVLAVAGAAVLACVLPASQAARLSVTSALRTE
jgi:ABC-type antimicrobial peptide transport system permease subunit